MIDFVGRVFNTGEIFDLTLEKVAKENNVHFEGKKYEPSLVILGAKMVVKGVEKQLLEMNVGESRKFMVNYADAFGRRDPRLVKILSFNKFIEQKINPVPGDFVNIDGMNAKIHSVSGGRVRVDFNNPLSGKDLEYEITIVKQITDVNERVDLYLKHSGIDATAVLTGDSLEIKTKGKLNNILEKMLDETIKKWIKEIKTVKFSVHAKEAAEDKGSPKTESSKGNSH